MAFFANLLVQMTGIRRPLISFLLLLASLGLGLWVTRNGGFMPTFWGRAATVAILTCPMLFSGVVFSTLLARKAGVSGVMGMNLLGSMFGGMLEYNSMYFGFQSLYWFAMGLYALAMTVELSSRARTG
jgi:hypothetical protein